MAPKSERFELRLEPEMLDQIDAWRLADGNHASRAEAIRRLVEIGIEASKPQRQEPITISDGERLLIAMLGDIARHLKVKGDMDTAFVEKAISGGHFWALGWELPGTLHRHTTSEAVVKEVVDFLDMWSFIEEAQEALSESDRQSLAARLETTSANLTIPGFDGNNESTHLSTARFLINEMQRFERFKGRELNSHHPVLEGYREMFNAFEPMRAKLVGIKLSVDQIVTLVRQRHNK
jgi:uncharacterized protein